MSYVNPKHCVHRKTSVSFVKDDTIRGSVFVKCDFCPLYGPDIQVGIFRWWAVARATRAFYRLANLIDKSGDPKC